MSVESDNGSKDSDLLWHIFTGNPGEVGLPVQSLQSPCNSCSFTSERNKGFVLVRCKTQAVLHD